MICGARSIQLAMKGWGRGTSGVVGWRAEHSRPRSDQASSAARCRSRRVAYTSAMLSYKPTCTHRELNHRLSACEADVIPLHHESMTMSRSFALITRCCRACSRMAGWASSCRREEGGVGETRELPLRA
jgi:hypothetical protein